MKHINTLTFAGAFLLFSCSENTQEQVANLPLFCLNGKTECIKRVDERSVELKADTNRVTPETPFHMIMKVDNYTGIEKVSGYMEGVSMYMGKIPLLFHFDKENQRFVAPTLVGSCSDPQMHWRVVLDVTINKSGQLETIQVVENFYSYR